MNDLPDNLRGLAEHRAVGKGRSIEDILASYRDSVLHDMVTVPYAKHAIMPSAVGEKCSSRRAGNGSVGPCTNQASHKLGEEGGDPTKHNLTAYVCCSCFTTIMGRCG
jgi:hypothetical protein